MLRGTPEHPKFVALARRLEASRPMLVGLLELLWHFTAAYAPAGDVGRWPDDAIEGAVGWDGEPGAFVAGLVACRWLDEVPGAARLVVHDWCDHSDRYVRRKLARRGQEVMTSGARRAPAGRLADTRRAAPPVPVPEPEPEPEPEPVPEPEPEPVPVPAGEAASADLAPDVEPGEFWNVVKSAALAEIPKPNRHWLKVTVGKEWRGRSLLVEVPDAQHARWIRQTYRRQITAALAQAGKGFRIRLVVRDAEPATLHNGGL